MESSAFRTPDGVAVPAVTAEEMRDVDRVAVEEVGLTLPRMMEHAGRALARQALDTRPSADDDPVIVLAGGGGNGGGGLVCARHLSNRGIPTTVVLDRPSTDMTGVPGEQLAILEHTDANVTSGDTDVTGGDTDGSVTSGDTDVTSGDTDADVTGGDTDVTGGDTDGSGIDGDELPTPSLVVDALLGYGLRGAPQGRAATLVEWTGSVAAPVLSLDVPSGVDATTGETPGTAVRPELTLTLALPKTGLVGRPEDLVLADLSIPVSVYDRLDIPPVAPFGDAFRVSLAGAHSA